MAKEPVLLAAALAILCSCGAWVYLPSPSPFETIWNMLSETSLFLANVYVNIVYLLCAELLV